MIDLASPQRLIITATRFQYYRILHKKFIHDTRKSCLSLPGFQLQLLRTPSMEKGIERMSWPHRLGEMKQMIYHMHQELNTVLKPCIHFSGNRQLSSITRAHAISWPIPSTQIENDMTDHVLKQEHIHISGSEYSASPGFKKGKRISCINGCRE